MAKYPENSTIAFENPFPYGFEYKTMRSSFGAEGEEKRKQRWLYPKPEVGPIKYEWITKADFRTLWEFYQARAGGFGEFNFFFPNQNIWVGIYIGTGDGSTDVFNLPCKTSSSRTLYVDGDSQTEGVDYAFTAGGGVDGADKVDFSGGVTPAAGEYITLDFTGLLKVRLTFADDKLTVQEFYDRLTKTGIKFKGHLNQ
jgi:hypothetical protein